MVLPAIETRTSYLNRKSSGIWDWISRAFCYVSFCCASSHYFQLPITSAGLGFCRVWLPLDWVSEALRLHLVRKHSRASAVLGFRLAEVATARLHPGHGRDVSGECIICLVQSQCNKYLKTKTLATQLIHLHDPSPGLSIFLPPQLKPLYYF